MKSFKEYLTESKKVYEFKVKIAGECPTDCQAQIKAALAEFHVATVSTARRTPIQERHSDFPEHKNISMTIFDVTTNYPANSLQVRERVASGLGMAQANVKVKTLGEEAEYVINHQHDERTHEAIVGTDYEPSDNSGMYGEKYNMSFLKELNKEQHVGTQVKGVNDQLLADGVPGAAKEYKTKTLGTKVGTKSAIGTHQNKIPDPMHGAR
jgi:hypothetical protein